MRGCFEHQYRYVRRRFRVLAGLIDAIGWMLRRGIETCGFRREAVDGPVRSILVVQLDHLGDAVLSTGMLAELRRRAPLARIEVLAAPWNRDVFAGCPQVDEVHVLARSRFARGGSFGWPLAMLRWSWKLRSRRFDLAIDPRGELPVAVLMWLAGARRRIGWNAAGGGFLLTDSPCYVPGRSETASRAALIETIWPHSRPARACATVFDAAPEERRRMRIRLASAFPDSGPLLVLHLGAGTQAKRWPTRHWRQLATELQAVESRLRIVLVGGGDDRPVARAVCDESGKHSAVDWTGQLKFSELAALLEAADLLVGADSGPAHLAAALATPVVVLFSGTSDPRVWAPHGRAPATVLRQRVPCAPCHLRQCPLAHHPCMTLIDPAAVAREIGARLYSTTAVDENAAACEPAVVPVE